MYSEQRSKIYLIINKISIFQPIHFNPQSRSRNPRLSNIVTRIDFRFSLRMQILAIKYATGLLGRYVAEANDKLSSHLCAKRD